MAPPLALQRPRSLFKSVLLPFVVVLALTVAVTNWWRQRTPADPPQVIHLPPVAAPQPAPRVEGAATASVPAAPSETNSVVPALTAWVVFAGQDNAISGDNISLPSGAQFAVKVLSNVDGELAFFTINPNGESADRPLWTSAVRAGTAVSGPDLRLKGTKGLETLRVILRPSAGGDEIEQHVQIWHQ
jgi:hypothetical protein